MKRPQAIKERGTELGWARVMIHYASPTLA
jgi:hypothetical protein